MKTPEHKDIVEIVARWRARAHDFMSDAGQSRNPRDVTQPAGMSSTLVWCANDLCVNAGVDAGRSAPASAEAQEQADAADTELGRVQQAEGRQP